MLIRAGGEDGEDFPSDARLFFNEKVGVKWFQPPPCLLMYWLIRLDQRLPLAVQQDGCCYFAVIQPYVLMMRPLLTCE